MLTQRTVLLAKIETAYGVDAVPTVGANALMVRNVDIKPAGDVIKRDMLRASLSQLKFLRGVKRVELSFDTELKGTGTRGALPSWGFEGTLFRACAMAETVTADASIVYSPISDPDAFESVTIHVYKDKILHKVAGCRGSWKISGKVGEYGTISWTFQGLHASAVDATPGAQTYSTVDPPVILGANLSIGGYAPVAESVEIDINNTLAQRKSINAASGIIGHLITSREPQGSFDPEVVTEATHGFWTKWESAETMALSIGPVGNDEGNIITIAAPAIQYKELTYGDNNGILTYSNAFAMAGDEGDDEVTVTFT